PITSRTKGYPFEVALPAGLPVHGAVLSDQVKSLDWRARNAGRMGSISTALVHEILKRLGVLLAA
ncbi:MAG: type II toxin-antitoxin system PemK/MazF family toxin, partial [Trueperaceae bacterium]